MFRNQDDGRTASTPVHIHYSGESSKEVPNVPKRARHMVQRGAFEPEWHCYEAHKDDE